MQNQIENVLTFDVAWPPAELSPNARVHWAVQSVIRAQYKSDCYRLAIDARNKWQNARKLKWPALDRAIVTLEFQASDHRRRDMDNLQAMSKPLLDSLCLPQREGDYGAGLIVADDAAHLKVETGLCAGAVQLVKVRVRGTVQVTPDPTPVV